MFFLYDQPVTAEEIKTLVLRSIISEQDDDETPDHYRAPVTDALLAAFATQSSLESEDDEEERCTQDAEESYRLYRKTYFKAFPGAQGDDGLGHYPETLPERGGIPRDIIIAAAAAIARRDRARARERAF